MPATWHRLFDPERVNLAPPLAWAIGAAAIMSVFAIVVMIVNYAPLNRDSVRRVETELTPATYETVGALVKASGNSCVRVCRVTAAASLTTSTTLDVACAMSQDANACLTPLHYNINVEPTTGPQR